MNLRSKALLLTTLPLLGFLVVVYASVSVILQRSYTRLEQQDAQRNVQRVGEALNSDLTQMQSLTEDWAAWDDTYQFIQDRNTAFVSSNFQKYAFESLRLNVVVLVNTEGEVIYSNGYDLESATFTEVPPSVLDQLQKGEPLMRFPHLASHHQGLIPVDDHRLLVVVEPILRSDATGPPRGALLMGRYLDAAVVDSLAQRTRLRLEVHGLPTEESALQPMLDQLASLEASPNQADDAPILIQPHDHQRLGGYALWPNIYGQPQALLEISLPRDIYRQGQLSRRSLGLALLAACVISTVAILLLLDRMIVRRVVKLSQEVQEIDEVNELTHRVTVRGKDEISHLGQRVNAMLEELQESTEKLQAEQQRAEDLLLNILPEPIADELMQTHASVPHNFDAVTILFADIVGFTQLSSRLSPIQLVEILNHIFSSFDNFAEQFGLEKIKTIGDAYMVAAGLPIPRTDHAEAIAEMALAMQQLTMAFGEEVGEPLQIRVGINTGVVVAGVIGTKKFIYDLWGDAVNVASRMESSGEPGRIQVTTSTYERLKDAYLLEPRGTIQVKGRGQMDTYWLRGRRDQPETKTTPAPGLSDNQDNGGHPDTIAQPSETGGT
jgi:adenylate cyclase